MKKLLIALAATIGFAMPATAQVVQPVYTRPSKGAALTIVNQAPSVGIVYSSVFDMTAFAEAQFESTVMAGAETYVQGFNVSQLGRYIKVSVQYTQSGGYPAVIYEVLNADTTAGPFILAESPGARQVVRPTKTPFTFVKLGMTPLPYSTVQYTRPSKGINFEIYSGVVAGATYTLVDQAQFSPIDMRGFAAISISSEQLTPVNGLLCTKAPLIELYGSDSPGSPAYLLDSENASRIVIASTDYIAPVSSRYLRISVVKYALEFGGTTDCSYRITATPIPYTSVPGQYGRSGKFNSSYTAVTTSYIKLFMNNTSFRVQNTGSVAIGCTFAGTDVAPTDVVFLSPQTAIGNGGVFERQSYYGPISCHTVSAGTGAFTISSY